MVHDDIKGYNQLLPDVQAYTATLDTEWSESKNNQIGQEIGLHIEHPVFDESCHLMLSIGIEFGTSEYGKVKVVRYAGCGKILRLF